MPSDQRRDLVCDLTERIVETYCADRGFDVPEFSYVLHTRKTDASEGEAGHEHLHTHVILPGTAPTVAERLPVYNNSAKGHDVLFREIGSRYFSAALDEIIGPDWRRLREDEQEIEVMQPEADDLDAWFGRG